MFVLMPISRRQFFGRFLGSGELTDEERSRRITMLESRMRGDLLPYDFTLDTRQTAELFDAIRARLTSMTDQELNAGDVRALTGVIEATLIQPWRSASWKASEVRQAATLHISEFLSTQATPENLQQLRHRFNIPNPTAVEEEVQRQAQRWLDSLSDSRILEYDAATVRELVFSELRSWC
jgi:hypothetical protein